MVVAAGTGAWYYKNHMTHTWEYGHEETWPYLGDPNFQSPIEVPKKGGERQLPGSYLMMKVANVQNNGHAFQLNYGPDGGGKIETEAHPFTLVQFHFHSPSEHKQTGYAGWTDTSGKQYPGHYAMEVHFVHTDGTFKGKADSAPQRNDLAVVGVFIKAGAHNPELERIWKECPDTSGKNEQLAFETFDAAKLMPSSGNYQNYKGSLTTPPLSSGVSWFVMDDPIEASPEQIERFRTVMKRNTNRSIQGDLNSRIGRQ